MPTQNTITTFILEKYKMIFVAALVLLSVFCSCKESVSISRDVILTPPGAKFIIPVISSTNAGTLIGNFQDTISLDQEVRNATGDFGIANLRDLKVTAMRLDLDTLKDHYSGNLENFTIEITSGNLKDTLAILENNSNSKNNTISIPVRSSTPRLREIMSSASFTYKITGKLRTATTVPLSATLTPTFTIKLSL
ncbi:MAG TPA: hypothetical protein VKB19_11625 [Pedobacter sp.]|nr:hypothetical protein [Pedobacter sp.]